MHMCVFLCGWAHMGHGTHVKGQPGMLGLTFHLVSDMVSLKFMAVYVKLPGLIAISHFSIAGLEIQKCTAASDCVGSGDLNLGPHACQASTLPTELPF